MRLPSPHPPAPGSFEAVLAERRSIRDFCDQPASLAAAGALLWAAQGTTGPDRRTAPSAAGSFPLSLTLVAGNAEGVEAGAYSYRPADHAIDPLGTGDFRPAIQAAAIGDQPWLGSAALIIVISADLDRAAEHFADQPPTGLRGQRYAHIEVGHVAQNAYLQATALGLGAVLVGGFDDEMIRALDPPLVARGHEPLGLLAVGQPACREDAQGTRLTGEAPQVSLVNGPEEVKRDLVADLTAILADLVAEGAALGWVEPPGPEEVSHLLMSVATKCACGDAALALARIDGHLVGFGYWRRYERPTHRPHADLEKVAVTRSAQGSGVGRALVAALVSAARAQAVEQLTLDLRADNLASHGLCLSMGFRDYARLPEFVAVGDKRYDKIMCVLDLRR